jgi:hypothetical protein
MQNLFLVLAGAGLLAMPAAAQPGPLLSATLSIGPGVTTNAPGFFAAAATYAVGKNPGCVVAFTNADGRVDLVCANTNDNTLTLLTNNGSGVFTSNVSLSVPNLPCGVTAADVNGDGRVDLICASINNPSYQSGNSGLLTVLTNNGSGGFLSNAVYSAGSYTVSVTTADVNKDGKLDLICANFGNDQQSTLSVLTNNGSGFFTTAATINVGGIGSAYEAYSVTTADVNNDGWVDLICVNTGNNGLGANLSVFTNNHNGGFAPASTPTVGNGPVSVAAADVNNDGWVDLISANAGSGNGNTLSVLTNDGSGGFALASTPVVGHGAHSVVAADVNGDGWIDLICASANDNTISVLMNNGSGGFVRSGTYAVGSGPVSVTAADVNGDGWVDLICANSGTNTISVLTNIPPTAHTNIMGLAVLSWPSPSAGYVLQQNSSLGTPNWTNFGGTVTTNVTTLSVTIPAAMGAEFFRLMKQD